MAQGATRLLCCCSMLCRRLCRMLNSQMTAYSSEFRPIQTLCIILTAQLEEYCNHHKISLYFWHSEDCASWYILVTKPQDALISQIYFWNGTLHVSDSLSVHPQESGTVHTATGICHTGFADCLLVGSGWNWFSCVAQLSNTTKPVLLTATKQSAKPVWHIPIAVCTVLDSWWWTERLSKTCRVPFQK